MYPVYDLANPPVFQCDLKQVIAGYRISRKVWADVPEKVAEIDEILEVLVASYNKYQRGNSYV